MTGGSLPKTIDFFDRLQLIPKTILEITELACKSRVVGGQALVLLPETRPSHFINKKTLF